MMQAEKTHRHTHTLSFTLDLLQSCTQIQFQLHDLRRHANASLSDVKALILKKETVYVLHTVGSQQSVTVNISYLHTETSRAGK